MSMRLLLILFILISVQQLSAQHCGYDGAALLVVYPHAPGDSAVTDGLRVTLLDSSNIPYEHNGRAVPPFMRNNDASTWDEKMLNHRPQKGAKRLFPFAGDNYVLIVPRGMDLTGWHVLIQQFDCGWFEKCVQQELVPLTSFDSYSLCGTYDDFVYPNHSGKHEYKPVNVELVIR